MNITARQAGLLTCPDCGLMSRIPASADLTLACPRCGATLHTRKPDSLARTWALLIAAAILYLPANLLPMMETTSLFSTQSDTILSGVIFLWQNGSQGLAVIVFTASILVPMLKLIALSLLAASVQWQWRWRPSQRTRLYRLIEVIGRWSMLDVFVVGVLAAIVQMHAMASVVAGPGALAFTSVVVLTMIAAMTFDPRLIWDPCASLSEIDDDD